jgi:1-acyl-sn-glycerol-3-phosphate acyltransferase
MFAAFLRTLAVAIILPLYILLVGPPSLIWALVTRRPDLLYTVGSFGVRLSLAVVGIRLNVVGLENIQRGPAVYACNHSSNIEPPAVFLALRPVHPRLGILYKAELRKLPVLVWAFDLGGFVPIERANKDQSWPAVDRAAEALGTGQSFVIFPEGTRSRTGELLPFKKGGFVMALKAHAPVVPVAVSGGRLAMRKGSRLIWPVTVTVDIGAPVATSGMSLDDRDGLIADVRADISGRLPRKTSAIREV